MNIRKWRITPPEHRACFTIQQRSTRDGMENSEGEWEILRVFCVSIYYILCIVSHWAAFSVSLTASCISLPLCYAFLSIVYHLPVFVVSPILKPNRTKYNLPLGGRLMLYSQRFYTHRGLLFYFMLPRSAICIRGTWVCCCVPRNTSNLNYLYLFMHYFSPC